MIRRTLLACSIALLTCISSPNPGWADELVVAKSEQPEQPEGREQWRERLLAANQRLAGAQKRSTTALRAYEIMRHRRRPRGEGKQAIMDELERSRAELASAEQNLAKLEKAARHAGAPPSWLKFTPDEINAPIAVPASPKP